MAVDLNDLVGSVVSISSTENIDVTSFKTETSTAMDTVRNIDTMRKIDNTLRRQSHKLMDRFRRIRRASKIGQDAERRMSTSPTNTLEDRENQAFVHAKTIADSTVRRQSPTGSSLELGSLTNGQLKPKVRIDRQTFSYLSCLSFF